MIRSKDLWPHAYCFEQDSFMLFEDPETSEVLINTGSVKSIARKYMTLRAIKMKQIKF